MGVRRADRSQRRALRGVRGARSAAGGRGDDPDREPNRMGAVTACLLADGSDRASLQHPAAPPRPRAPDLGRQPGPLRGQRGPARPAARRRCHDDPGRSREGDGRGAPPGAAGPGRGPPPHRGGADRVHLRHHRRAPGRSSPAAVPGRPTGPSGALAGGARGRAGLVHDGHRLVEVGPQRLRGAVALRGGRAPPRGPFRPRRAPGADRARGRQRPLPGADRVPDDRQAGRAPAAAVAATDGLGGRSAEPRGDRGLSRRASGWRSATGTARRRPAT